MSALDIKKDPNLEKVKEKMNKTSLDQGFKDKRRFQRIRAAIKRKKKSNSGK